MRCRLLLCLLLLSGCEEIPSSDDAGAFDSGRGDAGDDPVDAGAVDSGALDAGLEDANGAADAGARPDGGSGRIALSLDSANTGVRGGVVAGECAGESGAPYAGLTPHAGSVIIDETFVSNELGGVRVFEGFDVDGQIIVRADDVMVRCGRVSGNSPYSIQVEATGLELEWVEAEQTDDGKTILGGNYTAHRCDIYGGEDSVHINTGTVVITECYIHDQNFIGSDPHPDAVQATSGGTVDEVRIERSKLINFYRAPNAPVQINVATTWSVRDSYLWGGVYMINGDPGMLGQVHDNYFGWDSSQFGAIGGVSAERSGNVWWEWLSPRCGSAPQSASSCDTPSDHPGNGTPL